MIDFYVAPTPNAHKVMIMLEELGLEYTSHNLDLAALDQKKPEFLAMNPNGRMPVIVDHKGAFGSKQTVFESGAILYYLAEKANGKFLGHTLPEKTKVMQWVMFQMSGIGPNFGNYYYGVNSLKPLNSAYIERFEKESKRLLSVMNVQFSQYSHLAGEDYSIADMATYPWVAAYYQTKPDWFTAVPSVKRWLQVVAERPAVKKILG